MLAAPNVYAYSVDDAVGNLQADATGFIIAVGGTRGLPNPTPAAPPVNVNFGYGRTDKVRFEKYGICTAKPNIAVDPTDVRFDLARYHLPQEAYTTVHAVAMLVRLVAEQAMNALHARR